MFTLREVLDLACRIEHNGEAVYREAQSRATDPEMAEMLRWMADQERQHARHFDAQRRKLAPAEGNRVMEEFGRLMLTSIVGDQSFSLHDVDFSTITDTGELLQVLIAFEQDTLAFYRLFASLMQDDDDRRALEQIIADEEAHIRKLQACRDQNLACHRL